MTESLKDWTDDAAIDKKVRERILSERLVHLNLDKALGKPENELSKLDKVLDKWKPKVQPEIQVVSTGDGSITIKLQSAAEDWQSKAITTYEVYVNGQKYTEIVDWEKGKDWTITHLENDREYGITVMGKDSVGQPSKHSPQILEKLPIVPAKGP